MKAFEQIKNDINNRIFKPVYFLYGEEPYFIDAITNHLAKRVLSESERSFNQTILYGKETDISSIIEMAKRFPMMSSHQVVIVKEAQHLKNIGLLEHYLEHALVSTILVFAWKSKNFDGRLKVAKLIKEKGLLYKSPKIYDNQIGQWIQTYLSEKSIKIDPKAVMLLSENIGANLSRLVTELDKLMVVLPKDSKLITSEMVEQNTGIHRDFNVFELQKALGMRNSLKAYQITSFFAYDYKNNPVVMIIPRIFDYFLKLMKYHMLTDKSKNNVAAELGINIYFVDEYAQAARNYPPGKLVRIISYLRQADAQNKGVETTGMEEADIYKELIFKILN